MQILRLFAQLKSKVSYFNEFPDKMKAYTDWKWDGNMCHVPY